MDNKKEKAKLEEQLKTIEAHYLKCLGALDFVKNKIKEEESKDKKDK